MKKLIFIILLVPILLSAQESNSIEDWEKEEQEELAQVKVDPETGLFIGGRDDFEAVTMLMPTAEQVIEMESNPHGLSAVIFRKDDGTTGIILAFINNQYIGVLKNLGEEKDNTIIRLNRAVILVDGKRIEWDLGEWNKSDGKYIETRMLMTSSDEDRADIDVAKILIAFGKAEEVKIRMSGIKGKDDLTLSEKKKENLLRVGESYLEHFSK